MSRHVPNGRILIIDDNRAIHEDFRKILAEESFEGRSRLNDLKSHILKKKPEKVESSKFVLHSAYQGQEGYQYLKDSLERNLPYALAFVDMRMPPGWDGLETITHLWELDPELQIVICSAYSDYEWGQILQTWGMNGNLLILKKPFDREEVLQSAYALTKKWDLHRQNQEHLQSLENLVEARTASLVEANRHLQTEIETRERIEVELRLAQKLESIGHLAAGIAHEINTPTQFVGDNMRFLQEAFQEMQKIIQAIDRELQRRQDSTEGRKLADSLTGLLSKTELEYFYQEIPKALNDSLGGIQRIAEIVRAMKEFSHPGVKDEQPTNINALIENAVTVSRNEWKYSADLNVYLDPTLPLISCYPGELSQVILNMIVNAVHAIESVSSGDLTKGRITIATKIIDEEIEVTIADTGGGIPEHIQGKIYDPFFTTKEVGKGTGQGLAIARSLIVEKLHGSVNFQTELGKGTTFFLRIPVHSLSKSSASKGSMYETSSAVC